MNCFDEEPEDPHYECGLAYWTLEQELARKDAEITRLNVLCESRLGAMKNMDRDKDVLIAENQRLRAALERCRRYFVEIYVVAPEEAELEQMCADLLGAKE